jgi:hypothetical protein
MPSLINKVLLTKYVLAKWKDGGVEKDGVNLTMDYFNGKMELPIKGCVDFTVTNVGTAKAYINGNSIVILPGQSWSPPKSTPLPIINQPSLSFENDFENTRNINDVGNPNSSTN